jgi:protein involved in polysaccharide export with SLBB domain
LEIAEYSKRQVRVLGQVERPGVVDLPAFQEKADLMEVIGLAGGVGKSGDLNKITVKRMVDGRETSVTVNAKQLSKGSSRKGFEVMDGDTIFVSMARRDYSILGQIRIPGVYEIPAMQDSVDIMDAIARAGGTLHYGSIGSVRICREEDGVEKVHDHDEKALKRVMNGEKIQVRAGDRITVTLLSNRFTVLGQVRSPGMYEIPNFQETVSILEAVAMAGGATRLADLGSVTVRRMINEKEGVVKVDVKALSRSDKEKPFPILPGDKITVGERLF